MKSIKNTWNRLISQTFLTNRFFIFLGCIIFLFALSFSFKFLFYVAQAVLILFFIITIIDFIIVKYFENKITCERNIPSVLSLGEIQKVQLFVKNNSKTICLLNIIDELPFEFQKRDFEQKITLYANAENKLEYTIRPTTRGIITFGNCNIFASSLIGIVQHKIIIHLKKEILVYPSKLQVEKHSLQLFKNVHQNYGLKKQRRIGHSYEFEQIKNYTAGDDIRNINWKATGRKSELMINQYTDEKSQQIYAIIDKSRAMNLPFNGLSLTEYAVNTTLVIANTAIQKDDKAGVLTFNEKIGFFIKADKKPAQLKIISEVLFKEEISNFEANFELLYTAINRLIKQRSLLILYTNFESIYTMERYLPILRKISTKHLLLVVIFKNTEIEDFAYQPAENTIDIYEKTIAKKLIFEKQLMAKELDKYGIQSLITTPENLSTETINKYLGFKAKGWL